MPAPYSDNLYSAGPDESYPEEDQYDQSQNHRHQEQHHGPVDDQEEEAAALALSPTDGYFHASSSFPSSSPSSPHFSPSSPSHSHHPPAGNTDGIVPTFISATSATSPHYASSSNVPSVPNVLVEDPTLRTQKGDVKADEAEAERRLNSPPSHRRSVGDDNDEESYYNHSQQQRHQSAAAISSPHLQHHHSPSSSSSHRHPHHTNTLPHAGDVPPPAYSPPLPQHQQAGYSTFPASISQPDMGRPDETQRLLSHNPESMGSPTFNHYNNVPSNDNNSDDNAPKPFWHPSRLRDSRGNPKLVGFRKWIARLWKTLLILVLLLMLASALSWPSSLPRMQMPRFDDEKPVKAPPSSGPDDFRWEHHTGCYDHGYKTSSVKYDTPFMPENSVRIVERFEDKSSDSYPPNYWQPRVWGKILVQPANSDAEARITSEVMVNDEDAITVQHLFDEDTLTYQLVLPRRVRWSRDSAPCIQIRIILTVPSGSELGRLAVESTQLTVEIVDGVQLAVGSEAKRHSSDDLVSIKTVSGSVKTGVPPSHNDDTAVAPYTLKSRDIRIETVSGSVRGFFPFYDGLHISSTSGTIHVLVDPRKADKHHKPAVLEVRSVSGTINLQEPLPGSKGKSSNMLGNAIPARDYVTRIESTSGSITALVAFSSSADIETKSGHLELDLFPVLDTKLLSSSSSVSLSTRSISGSTSVSVYEPWWVDPDNSTDLFSKDHDWTGKKGKDQPVLSCLKSEHQTTGGRLNIQYPASWEGKISSSAISGSLQVRGKGVTIDSSSKWPKRLEAHKGDGHSTLHSQSISGSHDILIGEK